MDKLCHFVIPRYEGSLSNSSQEILGNLLLINAMKRDFSFVEMTKRRNNMNEYIDFLSKIKFK